MKKTITIQKTHTIEIEHEIPLPYFFYEDKHKIWGLFENHVICIYGYSDMPGINFYDWDDFESKILLPFELSKLPEYAMADRYAFISKLNKIKHEIEQIGAQANAAKGTQNTDINLCEG